MLLKVFLGFFFLLILLLIIPLRLQIWYHDGVFKVHLYYLFFKWKIFPRLYKRVRQKSKKKKIFSITKDSVHGGRVERLLTIIQLISDLLPQVGRGVGYILRRLTLARCRTVLIVGGEDAAKSALRCAQIYAVFYSGYALLANLMRVQEFHLSVIPEFLGAEENADVELLMRLRLSSILWGGVLFIGGTLRVLLKSHSFDTVKKIYRSKPKRYQYSQ